VYIRVQHNIDDKFNNISNKFNVIDDKFLSLEEKFEKANITNQQNLKQETNKLLDINSYIDTVANIVEKGDYDDLRYFLNLTGKIVDKGFNNEKFFEHINYITNYETENLEYNMFSAFVLIDKGTSLENTLTILENLNTDGREGKTNLSLLDNVIIQADKIGFFVPDLADKMAQSGNTRAFIEEWVKQNGYKITDNSKNSTFSEIHSLSDKKDLVIYQGDKVAFFAQAVSSTEGVLPPSVLYWSSVQDGAIVNGTNFFDLSKLEAGVHDIYVKIGPGTEGTDTAKRRVVVLPASEKKNNGLGDQKDADNSVKGLDESNPGKKKKIFNNDLSKISELVTESMESKQIYQRLKNSMPPEMFSFFLKEAKDFISCNFTKDPDNQELLSIIEYLDKQAYLFDLAKDEFFKQIAKELLEKYYLRKELNEQEFLGILKDRDYKKFLLMVKNNLLEPSSNDAVINKWQGSSEELV